MCQYPALWVSRMGRGQVSQSSHPLALEAVLRVTKEYVVLEYKCPGDTRAQSLGLQAQLHCRKCLALSGLGVDVM